MTTARPEVARRPMHSFRSLRWLNGGVHWISAVVLLYAFISNGETTRAMMDSVAMRGEVKLGLIVGLIFLIRFIWVQSRRSGGGRWLGSSARMPQSKIRRITDWGIYLGVAASVVSGLLIAYLRPGAALIPEVRGFTTSSPALNSSLTGMHSFRSLWSGYAVFTRSTPLVLACKKERNGADCRGLAGPSRVRRRPLGHFAPDREKISSAGPQFVGWKMKIDNQSCCVRLPICLITAIYQTEQSKREGLR